MGKTGVNRSAVDLKTAKTLARMRKLTKEHGPNEAARRVGVSKTLTSMVANGKRHKHSHTALDELGLKFSDKLCRRCGKECRIICKSLLCIVCELRELGKEGVVLIQVEGV